MPLKPPHQLLNSNRLPHSIGESLVETNPHSVFISRLLFLLPLARRLTGRRRRRLFCYQPPKEIPLQRRYLSFFLCCLLLPYLLFIWYNIIEINLIPIPNHSPSRPPRPPPFLLRHLRCLLRFRIQHLPHRIPHPRRSLDHRLPTRLVRRKDVQRRLHPIYPAAIRSSRHTRRGTGTGAQVVQLDPAAGERDARGEHGVDGAGDAFFLAGAAHAGGGAGFVGGGGVVDDDGSDVGGEHAVEIGGEFGGDDIQGAEVADEGGGKRSYRCGEKFASLAVCFGNGVRGARADEWMGGVILRCGLAIVGGWY